VHAGDLTPLASAKVLLGVAKGVDCGSPVHMLALFILRESRDSSLNNNVFLHHQALAKQILLAHELMRRRFGRSLQLFVAYAVLTELQKTKNKTKKFIDMLFAGAKGTRESVSVLSRHLVS